MLAPLLLLLAGAAAAFVPNPSLKFELSPAELAADCDAAREKAKAALDRIAALPAAQRSFDDTVWALDRAVAELHEETGSAQFLQHVAVSSSTRQASRLCENAVEDFLTEQTARKDLYEGLKAYAARKETLEPDAARLLETWLRDFRRSGLELPEDKRAELIRLRKRMNELIAEFQKNVAEVRDFVLFTREEMDGAPEDFLERLEKVDGKYKVGMDTPSVVTFMENVRVPQSRRALEAKFIRRAAPQNDAVLKELFALRRKAARLAGYPSHAHYAIEVRMAKDPETVRRFIARLRAKLTPLAREELKTLKALKRVYEGPDAENSFHGWDRLFYLNQYNKARHSLDEEEIKKYFPSDLVVERTLEIYQKLLGLKFRRVENATVWHPEVSLYEVSDAAGGEPIAYFYLDLFPRDGKYRGGMAPELLRGRALPGGAYRKPVSAIVANLNKPAPGKPALLQHDQLRTFFHEFGHVMHENLARARFRRNASIGVPWDFVEAPSQMLENWIWDPEMLQTFSGHYEDRSKKLPKALIERMIAARHANAGLFYLRQLVLASVDLLYNTNPPADLAKAWGDISLDVGLIPLSEGGQPHASFGHTVTGYDAGYYGYLWSQVFAQDMFSLFEKDGLMNPALGRRYRDEVLAPGSSRDEMDSLRAFLGREPNEDAFLKSIGLSPEQPAAAAARPRKSRH